MTRRNVLSIAAFGLAAKPAAAAEPEPLVAALDRIAMSTSPRYKVQAISPTADFVIQFDASWLADVADTIALIRRNYPDAYGFTCTDRWNGVRREVAA